MEEERGPSAVREELARIRAMVAVFDAAPNASPRAAALLEAAIAAVGAKGGALVDAERGADLRVVEAAGAPVLGSPGDRLDGASTEAIATALARGGPAWRAGAPRVAVVPLDAGEGARRVLALGFANAAAAPSGDALAIVAHLVQSALARASHAERLRDASSALARERARIASVVEQAPVPIIVYFGPDHVVSLANATARELFREPIIGRPARDILEPTTRASILAMFDRIYATGEGDAVSAFAYEGDGAASPGARYWTSHLRPTRDAEGRVDGIIVVGIDVTEEVHAHRRVDESRAAAEGAAGRYRLLTDAIPQIVWTARPDGTLAYLNRRASELTGLPSGAVPRLDDFVHPDDRAAGARLLSPGVEEAPSYEVELRLRGRDGRWHWFLARSVPLRNERGEVVEHLGTATDIDERKRSEQSARFLAEASAAFASSLDERAVVDCVAEHVVASVADVCVVYLREENRLVRASVRAKPACEASLPASPDPLTEHAERVITTGLAFRLDAARPGGALDRLGARALLAVPLVARGASSGVVVFVSWQPGCAYDDGDLELAEELARRAAAAIDNARLYRDARVANDAKDRFLAAVSHELRAPIAAIDMWTHVLRARVAADPGATQAVDAVRAGARALSRHIDDLLDLSRGLAGKWQLDLAPVDLGAVVQDALTTAAPLAAAKGVAVTFHADGEPTRVLGDAHRLRQLVENLVTNATKFTPRGGSVDVRLATRGDAVVLEVADTGCGIAPASLAHVFEPFWQEDASPARAHGGLGLGLAIARDIVDLHGGTLVAESAGVGKGATFTLELVRLTAAAAVEHRDALAGRAVVLLDPDAAFRGAVESALAAEGARVVGVASAALAFEALEAGAFDLLVVDVATATAEGVALLKKLRDLAPSSARELAILALVPEGDREAHVLAAGFHALIARAAPPEQIATAAARLARGRSSPLGASAR